MKLLFSLSEASTQSRNLNDIFSRLCSPSLSFWLSLSLSLSDRIQRKPLQLPLSSSVPYENITRESKFDNSVCETVSERIPECSTSFACRIIVKKQTPTVPPHSRLILSPHAHHYWTPDTLESRFPSMGKTFVQSNLFHRSPLRFFLTDFLNCYKVSTF